MMKVAEYTLLGIGPTPKEIKRQRQYALEAQKVYGRPIIFKHRWNLDDVKKGLASTCPYLDTAYHRSKSDCQYCFGTGFLGGFADGQITFVTLTDVDIDQLQISEQGYILYERHPQMVAPWYPSMGDGDLVMTAEFDRATWEVEQVLEVYELNDCKPTTIRGPFTTFTDYQLHNIQFTSKVDRVPNTHPFYRVPVEFNYNNIPFVNPPIGGISADYPVLGSFKNVAFRIIGKENSPQLIHNQTFNMVGAGTRSSTSFTFNMNADVSPTDVGIIFE